ncbi:MAG: alpha/beta hydrolase [Planctomycetota bacterium]
MPTLGVVSVAGLLVLLGLGLAVYLVVIITVTAYRMTHPPRITYGSALARNLPGDPSELDRPLEFEELAVSLDGNKIPTWDIRGRAHSGRTIAIVHGWGSSRVNILRRIDALADVSPRLLAIDLPGHGDAPGSTSLGLREPDVVRTLLDTASPTEPVVLYGSSMGAGIALQTAAQLGPARIDAVIAEGVYRDPITPAVPTLRNAGMPSVPNLVPALVLIGLRHGFMPTRRGVWAGFDRARIASGLRMPVLYLHGTDDEICPITGARRIAEATPEHRFVAIDGGHHNTLWHDDHRGAMSSAIADWLESIASG